MNHAGLGQKPEQGSGQKAERKPDHGPRPKQRQNLNPGSGGKPDQKRHEKPDQQLDQGSGPKLGRKPIPELVRKPNLGLSRTLDQKRHSKLGQQPDQGLGSGRKANSGLGRKPNQELDQKRHRKPDQGSAVIEFIMLGVLLLLPVAYLVLVLGRIQAATFAADGAAREAARAFVTAENDAEGEERAVITTELTLKDQGFAKEDGSLEVTCSNTPCLTPGGRVIVAVRITARFPWLPPGLAGGLHTQVVVSARQVGTVDEFRQFRR